MIRFKAFQLIPRWGSEVVANYKENWFQFLWFDITWAKEIDVSNIFRLRGE